MPYIRYQELEKKATIHYFRSSATERYEDGAK